VEETQAYIQHRLGIAGAAQPEAVFAREALYAIYESTGGIPRRINRLCDICLLSAMGAGVHTVEAALVNDEARALTV